MATEVAASHHSEREARRGAQQGRGGNKRRAEVGEVGRRNGMKKRTERKRVKTN